MASVFIFPYACHFPLIIGHTKNVCHLWLLPLFSLYFLAKPTILRRHGKIHHLEWLGITNFCFLKRYPIRYIICLISDSSPHSLLPVNPKYRVAILEKPPFSQLAQGFILVSRQLCTSSNYTEFSEKKYWHVGLCYITFGNTNNGII